MSLSQSRPSILKEFQGKERCKQQRTHSSQLFYAMGVELKQSVSVHFSRLY